MKEDSRALLAEKRIANNQRWLARLYLSQVPDEVRETLAKARVVVSPESAAIAKYQYADERGVGVESPIRFEGFSFETYRDANQVFDALALLNDESDFQVGYFQPRGFYPIEVCRTGPGDQPLFEVNFGWAKRHLAELCEPARHICALTTKNGEAGIVISVCCGYPNRPADEEVFELSHWGCAKR